MQKNKSFKLLMLIAVNLALLVLLSDLCTLRSYAINLGENGERIAVLQRNLKEKGYYNGEINGLFDFSTRKAVKNFKIKNKIAAETDYKTFSILGLYSSECNCYCAEVELLAKHLKSNGVIEYQDMIEACEEIIANSENGSIFGYVINMANNTDELINAKPNSEQYSAASETIRRYELY